MAGSKKTDLDKVVVRLWRHTLLRAAGAPDFVLKEGADLLNKAMKRVDPAKDHLSLSAKLFEHILEQTSQFYEPPFCLTCKKLEGCHRMEDGTRDCCGDYLIDSAAYETCKAQLFRAVNLLNGVFGFDASRMVVTLNGLLDAMKSYKPDSHAGSSTPGAGATGTSQTD
jgi:hypothetical protein